MRIVILPRPDVLLLQMVVLQHEVVVPNDEQIAMS